jgi:hypothetical protein
MASFSVSLTEWAARNRRRARGEKGAISDYGSSCRTSKKTGRIRFCFRNDFSSIDGAGPELRQPAQAVVRVDYQAPDKKTFNKTSEKGSGIVRHLVFDRLIQSESETSSGREHRNSAITTANYTFMLSGEEDVGPYHCFVLVAAPKSKEKYLFEGKVWIDAQDFAIVKIAGHPAKKPSFWINRADFVRQYQRIDGFWLPYRDETFVEVKIYGRRIFTVDHQQYVVNPAPLQAEAGDMSDED